MTDPGSLPERLPLGSWPPSTVPAGPLAAWSPRANNDVTGIAVNIAARIVATAGPGEIFVSRTVRDLVAGSEVVLAVAAGS
jgi:hypothetical protein